MKTNLYRLLIVIPLMFFGYAFGQNVNMSNGSSSACSGNFYDSGGSGGTYGASQTLVYTFCPSTPGADMVINFTSFNLENSFDFLFVYDGNTTGAPSLGTYTGTTGPGTVTASPSNPTGCLTFRFTSDGSVQNAGWTATVACSTPCPTITSSIASTTPAAVAGIIKRCPGQAVSFSATTATGGTAPYTYSWNYGNGSTGTGQNVSHTYAASGSYQASLTVTDANGCAMTTSSTVIVQVATTPTITTAVAPNPICLGQTANLTANVTMTPFVPNCTPPVSGTTFLPDGSGVSYTTAITVNCFNAGQTITAASNFSNICLNIEHSYLGDLQIVLICPNGQQMILKSYAAGGNGTFLGNPYDGINDATWGPGTGSTYCFTPSATTLLTAGATTAATGPTAGTTIVPGNYMPQDPFTNLIGCPLNGAWTIQVTDNLGSDNGYIFNWDVNFTVPPATGAFTPTIATQGWNAATGLTSTGATTATITPTAAGSPCYTYTVTDNFGCTFTQNQCITVNPNVPVNAGPDVSGCPGSTVTIGGAPSGPAGMTYSWVETGANSNVAITSSTTIANPTVTISAGATGTATYTVTGTSAGCVTTDVVVVTVVPPPVVSAGPDVVICAGGSTVLTATGATTYTWSPATGLSGTTTASVTSTPAATITYTVSGTTGGCVATDQVIVTVTPLNTIAAGINRITCINSALTSITLATTGATGATFSGLPAGVTGSWAGNVATISGTPTAAGTFNYTVTTTGGCPPATATGTITVNPLNTIAPGTSQTLCVNSPITNISLATTGATGATFSGLPAGVTGSWAGNVATISGTPTAAGTFNYTVTTTGGCPPATTTGTITVTPLNTIAAGTSPSLCINTPLTNITMATTGATGATFSGLPAGVTGAWAGNVATISGTPTASGTFIYTVTTTGGCPPATATGTITVNPLPTVGAGADQTVCAGASVTLSGSGAATYTWSPVITNGVAFVPAATTTYTVTGTSAAGCINTDQVLVTVNPLPVVVANDAGVCAGGTITLSASGASTYTWSPGTYLSATTGASVNCTPTATITYTVSGTSAAGCVSSDPITVTVAGSAPINAGPDVAICAGASTTLTATGGATYTWNNGLGAGNNFSVTPAATTTYTVVGTDAGGCTGTDAITVTVNPLPTVNAGLDQTVCAGGSVTLTATGAATYTWTGGVTNGVAFVPAATATYTVTGTTAAGCTSTDAVVVTVNPLPIVNAGADQTVCTGTAVTLSGSGAATYTWTGGVANGVAFTPAATATYTVTGTSAAGCINTDAVVVTVNPLPTVNAGADVAICIGASTTLTATGATTYTWTGGVTNGVAFSPAATATYTVTGTDANGCINTDAVVVTVNPLPTVNAGLDQAVCIGAPVTLTATGAATYTWTGGITNGVAFTPAATTTYTVTGTSAAGCINTDAVVVTVNPLPVVVANDVSVCTGGTTPLTASGAATYTWSPGTNLSATTGSTVNFTAGSNTTYTVTGTSAAGCVSTDPISVTVLANAPINAGPDVSLCAGASTTLTATGGTTYTWNNGLGTGNNFSITPAATTTYTVVGTDAVGCIGTDAITVTVNPLPIVNAGLDQTVCAGTTVTLTAIGAATYTWTGGITNGVAFTPASTITYTVTGTTAAGCTGTDAVLVTVNTIPVVNAGTDQTVCAGTAVTLTGAGAATYTWTGGVTNGVAFTPAATATYTVTGTSAAGCTATDQVVVTVNPMPTTNAGADQTVCAGTSVTLTATGASTYTWNNGVTNGIAFTPAVGSITYTVTGTTAAGCILTDQVIVTVNPNPVPVINGPTQYCAGFPATLSTSTPFTTYSWTTGASTSTTSATIANNPISVTVTNGFGCSATSPTFTVSENAVITANFTNTICQGQSSLIHGVNQTVAGVYSATYTSASGCDSVSNVTLVVNPLPAVNAGVDQAVCTTIATTLTATGASTYTWNNGVTNGIPFTQAIGSVTYTVTGTSAAGCVNTDQVVVTVNPLPVVNAGPDQTICIGASVTVSGSGASTYTWNNGVTNGTAFSPTNTNTYTVSGTNVNGCINTDQVLVTVNPLPTINAGTDQVTCIGGTVTLNGSGGTSYAWNNGVVNGVAFSPAATTTYTVTGTDANGCINTDQVLVTVNALPTVNAEPDQTVCIGTAVTLSGSGASTYTWNNGVTDGVAFTPAVGTMTYTVTGTSGANCIATDQVVVNVNPLPIVNAGVDQAICIGASATLSGSGATTYTWNNGVTNATAFSPTNTNTYTVTGTNVNGCINTDQVVVTVNPLPAVNAGADQVTCIGGTVTLAGSGASNYTWNNGVVNGIAFAPASTTTYTVTGTDVNGCINTDQVVVTVNPLPTVNAGVDQVVCLGSSVVLTGTGAATYSWNNGVNNGVSFVPTVGTVTYTVTGTSGPGCIATDQVVVTVNALPLVNAGPDQTICIGAPVTLSGSGASTYTWNNGVINNTPFNPTLTNTYTVIGTDVNGCTKTDQVTVTVNPLPLVGAGNDVTVCAGQSVTLSGVGAATYTWDNGVVNGVSFVPASTTTYTVTGTSAAGCINTDQVTVTVNPLPIVNAGIDQTVCVGTAVTLSGSGASTYSWNNGVTNGVAFTPAVGTVTYTVTGTSAAGCINTDQVVVTVNPQPVINAGVDQAVCAGEMVTLSASGGVIYVWNNGVTDGLAFTPVATTTYTVTGTDANGCVNTDQVVVTVNPIPTVFAGNDIAICDGQSVTLTGSGANIYTWDNGVTNGVAFSPAVGVVTYTVTGTTTAGCENTDQMNVLVNPLPNPSFMPDNNVGCIPYTVNIENTTLNASNCVWTISDGSVYTGCGTISNTFEQAGCFDITLTTTDINGCVNSFTAANVICVEAPPIAAFTPSDNELSTLYTEVLFDNNTTGAVQYSWSFGDDSALTDEENPTHTYPEEPGTYQVVLIATSPLGCVDTAISVIQVYEELLYYVPNTFTPDYDNYNQTFQPVFTSGFDPYDYTLLIYNRWGEVIFESHDATVGWNGSYGGPDGIEMVQDGTYTWKIEFKVTRNDERKMIVGHVNIIR
jgi:gliding motility-associated-like protein